MSGSDRAGGDRSQHIRALERAWRDAPTRVFVRLAKAYHAAGLVDEARAVLGHGLAETPGHLAGRVLKGRLAAEAGRLDAARRELEEVLARFPGHHGALLVLADLERLAGVGEAERAILEQLAKRSPDPAVLVRLAELDGESGARPRMPSARRRTVSPMTRPSAPLPSGGEELDEARAETIPSGPSARPGMFTRAPCVGGRVPEGPDPFTNATMAELLASQGDVEGALAMFAALVVREPGRWSYRERYLELGGSAGDLPAPAKADRSPAAELERALRDLVEGS